MIDVEIPPPCLQLMQLVDLTEDDVVATVNRRDQELIVNGLMDRLAAVRWVDDERLILVDSVISEKQVGDAGIQFEKVTVNVALQLPAELPHGTLTPDTPMEEILDVVARSFGHPLSGQEGAEHGYLYSGEFSGGFDIEWLDGQASNECCITAGVKDDGSVDKAWVFDARRFRQWREAS